MTLVMLSALLCGLSVQAADPVPLPLVDPGFERRNPAWSMSISSSGAVKFAAEPTHSGRRCIALIAETASARPWVYQAISPVQESATLRCSVWTRGEATVTGTQCGLRIEAFDAAGTRCGAFDARSVVVTRPTWTPLSVVARLPVNTVKIHVVLRLIGAGTVWFDDAVLEQIEPPRPFVLLGCSETRVERKRFDLDMPIRAYDLQSGQEELRGEVQIVDGDERLLETQEVSAPRVRDTTFTIKHKGLPTGAYSLSLRVPSISPDVTATRRLYVMTKRRAPKGLDKNGYLLDAEKQPFFPIGLYHVTTDDYARVAAQGFNSVQGITSRDLDTFGASLDRAHERGLKVEVPLYAGQQVAENLPASIEKIQRFRDHPALLSWKIVDEADTRPDVEGEVFEAYQRLSALKPPQPLLVSVYDPRGCAFWAEACDAIQVKPDPVPDRPFGMVTEWVRSAHGTGEPWQHTGAVLQAGWLPDLSNQPTYDQAVTMVHLAILEGAQSIFWYVLRDPGWDLMDTPLWQDFPRLNRLTTSLAAVMMRGTAARGVGVEGEGVVHAAREYAMKVEGKSRKNLYVCLANPSLASRTVIVSTGRKWKYSRSTGRFDAVPTGDGRFRVTLAPETACTLAFTDAK